MPEHEAQEHEQEWTDREAQVVPHAEELGSAFRQVAVLTLTEDAVERPTALRKRGRAKVAGPFGRSCLGKGVAQCEGTERSIVQNLRQRQHSRRPYLGSGERLERITEEVSERHGLGPDFGLCQLLEARLADCRLATGNRMAGRTHHLTGVRPHQHSRRGR